MKNHLKIFEASEGTELIIIHAAGIVTMDSKPNKEVHVKMSM